MELLLRGEVVEQQPARDPGRLRDQLDGQVFQPAGREQLDAERDQLGPPRLGGEPDPLRRARDGHVRHSSPLLNVSQLAIDRYSMGSYRPLMTSAPSARRRTRPPARRGTALGDTPAGGRRHVSVLVVGGGFAGLGAAIRLHKEGFDDFLVVERGSEVGGTWRDNTYPGAACDVPSHLYSYSFELNPNWSRSFSPQPEIQDYLRSVAAKYNVGDKHLFETEVTLAEWDTETQRWLVDTTSGLFSADVLIGAVGALCEPALPDIKGIENFRGELFHSARWNHDADLKGKRVALIGTGASAIQIGPAIADEVGHLDVYQRTAPWVMPRHDRAYSKVESLAYQHVPFLQRAAREAIYWGREAFVLGFAYEPKILQVAQRMAEKNIAKGIRDRELRAKVTPNWQIGCKRILISNTWYPMLAKDNVDLVTEGIVEVR